MSTDPRAFAQTRPMLANIPPGPRIVAPRLHNHRLEARLVATNAMHSNELLRYTEWADATIWQAVMASPRNQADTELKERLVHIHLVQWAFLSVWRQQAWEMREANDFATTADVLDWARRYHLDRTEFLEALPSSRFEDEVQLPWSDEFRSASGEVYPTTLTETMTQVALHSAHHRGQVCTRMRALGSEPPLVDYIAWLWNGRPQPPWPE